MSDMHNMSNIKPNMNFIEKAHHYPYPHNPNVFGQYWTQEEPLKYLQLIYIRILQI